MPFKLHASSRFPLSPALPSCRPRGPSNMRPALAKLPSLATQARHMNVCGAGDGEIRVLESGYKDRVKEFWQGRSDAYDVNNYFHPPLCAYLVKLAQISPGSAVLDVATGTGSVAFAAAYAVGPDGRVLGVDITDSMLQQAKAKAKDLGAANMDFQLADAEAVSFPAQNFDFILCSNGMAYLQDIPAAVKKFHSWLKPGGKLCFNNPQAPMIPLSATLIRLCAEKFGVAPEDAGAALGSEARIRVILEAAGFREIQVTGTEEVKVFDNTTPAKCAESIFVMMERFPAAPLSKLLSQEQIEELRAGYLVAAVPQAEKMPQKDGGIVNEYVMLWAVATA